MTDFVPTQALQALAHWAATRPESIAIRGVDVEITYEVLQRLVDDAAAVFRNMSAQRCALYLDNGHDWIVADLAARQAGLVTVPIPRYFSRDQVRHVLRSAGIDLLVMDQGDELDMLPDVPAGSPLASLGRNDVLGHCSLYQLDRDAGQRSPLPDSIRKLTYTSGTTGQPKGICLTEQAIDRVAHALLTATEASAGDRHLSILPYAALLENIAGIDVPLLAGAEICALPMASIGFTGSSGVEPQLLIATLDRHRPSSIVIVPQILQVLMAAMHRSGWQPDYFRHIAVGGAVLAEGTVELAREMGLPVFEGYGLSECSSVVTLNTRRHNRPGSVGRALPHARITINDDGEVLVTGAQAVGYLEMDGTFIAFPAGPVRTGDIGEVDADGYLHLRGRKKNIFITAFGRNVSPDWVESALGAMPSIAQAIVFGEARPWNVAVIVPRHGAVAKESATCAAAVAADVARVNMRLPDYARVRRWIFADAPFLPGNGLLTWNGRLRRDAIVRLYRDRIDELYQESKTHVS